MLAEKLEQKSCKQKIHLFKKYYKYAKKLIYKKIKEAIKKGDSEAYEHNWTWYISKKVSFDILISIDNKLKEELINEGFYIRKYQFGQSIEPFECTIAWGDKIEYHKKLDAYQEKMIKEKLEKDKEKKGGN